MISTEDKEKVVELARKHKARRVLLFGSSADPDKEASDIDLAVDGISPADFFPFYGELIFSLSKPVDLLDLSSQSAFARMIQREGVPLYG